MRAVDDRCPIEGDYGVSAGSNIEVKISPAARIRREARDVRFCNLRPVIDRHRVEPARLRPFVKLPPFPMLKCEGKWGFPRKTFNGIVHRVNLKALRAQCGHAELCARGG